MVKRRRDKLMLLLVTAAGLGGCEIIAGLEDPILDPSVTGPGGAGGNGTGTGQGGTSSSQGGSGGTTSSSGGAGGSAGGSTGVGGSIPGMVNVPGATFDMGCNSGVDDLCNSNEDPYHSVTLTGYRIDQLEVTRGDYFACVQDNACTEPTCDWDPTGMNLQNHPVTCVTWQDAADYCSWAGKRLPTEAEWEYAARGTTGNRYPWGNSFNADCSLANGNLCKLDTAPVGDHPNGVSPLGCLDMAGNVSEWVNDWYDAGYYANSPSTDPQGPSSGALKVTRGGSWNSSVKNFRVSVRLPELPTEANEEIGFRCAL